MRLLRNFVLLVALCLILGAPAAAEGPSLPAGREAGKMARMLGHLQDFLKAVWENEGFEIDPLGRNSPGAGASDDPSTPGADEGFQIDPWG
jgi:hypothetical protein